MTPDAARPHMEALIEEMELHRSGGLDAIPVPGENDRTDGHEKDQGPANGAIEVEAWDGTLG